jgi:PAS domain-containing protein
LVAHIEDRLRVFANRVLRRIFGLKSDEVRGEWIKLHNEELDDLYLLIYLPHKTESFLRS